MKTLLMQRSTSYKNVTTDVIQELVKLSQDLDVDPKKIAGSFDKFMAISRQASSSVTMDDVEAFATEQTVLLKKTKNISVFAKTEWDECVMFSVYTDVSLFSIIWIFHVMNAAGWIYLPHLQ